MGVGAADEYREIADLYDHVVSYRERTDVGFLVEAAKASGSPVLEVVCGTGRVLIPTARAGVETVGLDLSTHMLAVCRERLEAEPEPVPSRARLVQADMRRFELGQKFTLATIPFRPLQHLLTVDDQLSCLASIRAHLVDGGRLILDLFNPSLDMLASPADGKEGGDKPEFTTPDGRRVVRKHRAVATDRFSQVNDYELIYVSHLDGQQERLVQAGLSRRVVVRARKTSA